MKNTLLTAFTTVLFATAWPSLAAAAAYTFKNGSLERPTGYREWIYVGTPVTPNDMNNGKAAVSGNGYFQGEYIGLEATIKSHKLFPDEPGNWVYFSFSTPDHTNLKRSAEAFPTEACNACHQGAAADDFVFTQYYPVLRAGKAKGKLVTGGVADSLVARQ